MKVSEDKPLLQSSLGPTSSVPGNTLILRKKKAPQDLKLYGREVEPGGRALLRFIKRGSFPLGKNQLFLEMVFVFNFHKFTLLHDFWPTEWNLSFISVSGRNLGLSDTEQRHAIVLSLKELIQMDLSVT